MKIFVINCYTYSYMHIQIDQQLFFTPTTVWRYLCCTSVNWNTLHVAHIMPIWSATVSIYNPTNLAPNCRLAQKYLACITVGKYVLVIMTVSSKVFSYKPLYSFYVGSVGRMIKCVLRHAISKHNSS